MEQSTHASKTRNRKAIFSFGITLSVLSTLLLGLTSCSQSSHKGVPQGASSQDVKIDLPSNKADTTQTPKQAAEPKRPCAASEKKYSQFKTSPDQCFAMVIVKTGAEWRRILCEEQATQEVITQIQTQLKNHGFYRVAINERLDGTTFSAVTRFQKTYNLPTGGMTLEAIDCMGVDWTQKE